MTETPQPHSHRHEGKDRGVIYNLTATAPYLIHQSRCHANGSQKIGSDGRYEQPLGFAVFYPRLLGLQILQDSLNRHEPIVALPWVRWSSSVTAAAPGSAQGLYLIVSDIEATRAEWLGLGVEISEVFHDASGVYAGPDEPYLFGRQRVSGRDPEHRSYRSFASFHDPDGNGWLFQEITTRLPGRIDPATTTFASASDLASALRRAAAAHGEHEKRIGGADANWPDWYAEYMVAEQGGAELPT